MAVRLAQVIADLERCGTEQNRRVYLRHGVAPPLFGVSFTHLARLARKIGRDHHLAAELWNTGIHDARMLGARLADPAFLRPRGADAWLRDCANYVITEEVAGLVARSPLAESRARLWRDRRAEWPAAAGWIVTAHLVRSGAVDEEAGRSLLHQAHKEIHDRPNRVRHQMNGVVIAIGIGIPDLLDEALATADAIGEVRVDHGRTNCRTPDARAYIERTTARGGR